MSSNSELRSSSDCIGVLFGREQLSGCRASRTLFGTVRYQRATVQIADGDTDQAFAELLSQLGDPDDPLPIVAAIPTDECYFATRPTAGNAANASPRVLLRESLRSSATRLDQMAIDVINWQPDKRPVAGIAAVSTERVESIRECVAATGHPLQRLQPAAASLIGIAPEREGRDRRSGLTIRIFVGDTSMLAVMCRGTNPIYWQNLPLNPGDESTGIVSAIRSLEAAGNACGIDRSIDQVVIHGRSQLHALMDQQWLSENIPATYTWVDSPTLASDDVAKALADKFLLAEDEGFDFVRQHREPLKLRRVVPYKEIAAYIMAACVLAGVVWLRLDSVRIQHTAVIASAPPMVGDGTNPKPEKDRLNARAVAVSQFLDSRVQWSEVINDISRTLPEGMRLTAIRGSAAMPQRRKKQVKTSPTTLVLNAESALNEDNELPVEINTLAHSIKQIESINNHFKVVELSDVRRTRSQKTGVAGAEFSIVLTSEKKGAR